MDPLKITKAFMHARDEFSLQLSYTLARREREREQEREREGRIHCQRLQCGPEESSERRAAQRTDGERPMVANSSPNWACLILKQPARVRRNAIGIHGEVRQQTGIS